LPPSPDRWSADGPRGRRDSHTAAPARQTPPVSRRAHIAPATPGRSCFHSTDKWARPPRQGRQKSVIEVEKEYSPMTMAGTLLLRSCSDVECESGGRASGSGGLGRCPSVCSKIHCVPARGVWAAL